MPVLPEDAVGFADTQAGQRTDVVNRGTADAGLGAATEAGPEAGLADAITRDLKKCDVAGPDGQAAETSSCVPDPAEWCDGKDNDCDGVIDNGHVCPEPDVATTRPFSDGVYLQGTTSEGLCGTDALQRFWPTKEKTYYYGFDCYADLYQFRASDWQLFYLATFSGIHIDGATTATDTVVPTPPCGDSVFGKFAFDGTGNLHYMCSGSVRRGSGESVTTASALAAVLADGRVVVTRAAPSGSARFELVDRSGTTVSTLDLSKEFVGTLNAFPEQNFVTRHCLIVAVLTSDPHLRRIAAPYVGELWCSIRPTVVAGGDAGILLCSPERPPQLIKWVVKVVSTTCTTVRLILPIPCGGWFDFVHPTMQCPLNGCPPTEVTWMFL